MKRCCLFCVLAILSVMLCFGSCGEKQGGRDISVKEIVDKLYADKLDSKLDEVALYNDKLFQENSEKLYGIGLDKISDGAIIYSSDGACASEISILKCSDSTNAVEILEKRSQERLKVFSGYSPAESKKIEDCIIADYDGLGILIISENASEIENEIKKILS